MKKAIAAAFTLAAVLSLAGCPSTSAGGPHHTPPSIIIHKP